jgi:GGDEF domain-containing protein
MIDLDDFEQLNDTCGRVAERIRVTAEAARFSVQGAEA